MGPLDSVLYGRFPRDVGLPYRFTLFGEWHYDRVRALNEGERNLYASIAWEIPFDAWYCDKVSLDLDTPLKVKGDLLHPDVPDDADEYTALQTVRADEEITRDVLGPVVEDLHEIADWAAQEDVPSVGVFTGYGVHVHLLYRPARDPRNQLLTTANYLSEELGLETVDQQPVGDVARILRIPNCRRVVDRAHVGYVPVDCWTVPLTREEMQSVEAADLYELSRRPRTIPIDDLDVQDRPEMTIYEDYLFQTGYTAPKRTVDAPPPSFDTDSELADWIRHLLKMPCLYERVLTHNPHHEIRVQFAIKLFNCGYTVSEAHDLIRQLGWRDYDPRETDKQLQSVWNGKYGDWSCRKVKGEGFCMRLDDPEACPTYGWRGGTCFY